MAEEVLRRIQAISSAQVVPTLQEHGYHSPQVSAGSCFKHLLPSCQCHFQRLRNFLGGEACWQGEVTSGGPLKARSPCWCLILCLLVQREVTSFIHRCSCHYELRCCVLTSPSHTNGQNPLKSRVKLNLPPPQVVFIGYFSHSSTRVTGVPQDHTLGPG